MRTRFLKSSGLILVALVCLSAMASAEPLVQYIASPCVTLVATPCTQNGVVGASIVTSGGGAAGPAEFTTGLGTSSNFTFGFTATSAGHISDVSFGESNNDCQTGGHQNCSNASNWYVDESINGGPMVDIYNFAGGPPFTELNNFIPLNQSFAVGDTVEFQIGVTNLVSGHVSTASYGFDTITVDGQLAPEPGSLLLLGTGLLTIGRAIRRKIA